jgi:hypothetical protein
MDINAGIFIASDVTLSKQAKLRRVLLDLRQSDVAFLATEWLKEHDLSGKVPTSDISFLEQGWRPSEKHEKAIFAVLGIDGYER